MFALKSRKNIITAAQKWLSNRSNPSVLWILGVGLLFRTVVAFWLLPGFDEAYYYLYAQHLDWSYFDHPVLVALTTGLGTWLTGDVSQFTIRWGALIVHTGSLILLYATGVRLFSPTAARLTLAIASTIPIFQVAFGTLTLPDAPLIFFWSASLYCAASEFFPSGGRRQKVEDTPNSPNSPTPYSPTYRLSLLGILIGGACLGKYHGFVLGLGLVFFCLTSRHHRRALVSPWTALGLALFMVTIFPIWFWNLNHEWISFRFQLGGRFEPYPGEVKDSSFKFIGVFVAFVSGIGYLFPTLGFPLWWVSLRGLWQQVWLGLPFRNREKTVLSQKYWLILAVSLPLTLGFTILGGKEAILPTWAMPGFWSLTLLLGERATTWSQRRVYAGLKGTAFFLSTLLLFVLLHMSMGVLQKPSDYSLFGGFLSPKNDPSRELIDIKQLRRGFTESPALMEALENSRFIFTNAYYLSGYLGMALHPVVSLPITCFGNDTRGFAFWFQPQNWLGEDGLYVTLERFHEMPDIAADFSNYFQKFEVIGTISLRRGGAVTDTFYVYRAQNLLQLYPSLPQVSQNHV